MTERTSESDAPIYGCCQHCPTYAESQGFCEQAPHDDQCVQPYCSGGRPCEPASPPGQDVPQ